MLTTYLDWSVYSYKLKKGEWQPDSEADQILRQLQNYREVKVLPHVDNPFVMEAARRALARQATTWKCNLMRHLEWARRFQPDPIPRCCATKKCGSLVRCGRWLPRISCAVSSVVTVRKGAWPPTRRSKRSPRCGCISTLAAGGRAILYSRRQTTVCHGH
jgi:hypothetical protein